MENRLHHVFHSSGESAAFIAYLVAGDPNRTTTLALMRGLADTGVDILELGIAFSDPQADGAVNQRAAHRALESGMTLDQLFTLIEDFRKTHPHTPIVLFSYLNPIYVYGASLFCKKAKQAGADALLLLDFPLEERQREAFPTEGLTLISLIAPTTSTKRLATIAQNSEGFIYAVSRLGVTGKSPSTLQNKETSTLTDTLRPFISRISAHTHTPICVGFGIDSPQKAAQIAQIAQGVVVGSAIVEQIERFGKDADCVEKICAFVKPLIDATKKTN